jgi:hypothetical protein
MGTINFLIVWSRFASHLGISKLTVSVPLEDTFFLSVEKISLKGFESPNERAPSTFSQELISKIALWAILLISSGSRNLGHYMTSTPCGYFTALRL